ncbi:MAG: cation transporter [Clostridia bacterium]|nr:cation transporter [Clostridia bacterium]
MNKKNREQVIVRTSVIGIISNVLLSIFKAVVGLLSNSIAITLDAINNLSDALSSVITIIGAKLAGKAPDKEHPYGHGRIEYLAAMIIAIIVLYAGITALIESIKKIIYPETPDYQVVSLIIVVVAIVVKIILGLYVKKVGKKVKSDSLINSGTDALMDSIISMATLVSAIIFIFSGVSLEAWLGAIISIVIIKSGIEMLKTTVSHILGRKAESEIAKAVEKTVAEYECVKGAYDLILHNYGPDTYIGSIHVEVPDTMTAIEIDEMTRKIMKKVYEEHHVILAAVGIYALNTKDKEVIEARNKISRIVHSYKTVIQMHGFYLNKTEKIINFDIIIDFVDEDREKTYKQIYDKVQKEYPEYSLNITMDIDILD